MMEASMILLALFLVIFIGFIVPVIILRVLASYSNGNSNYSIVKKTDNDQFNDMAFNKLISKPFVLVHAHADDESMFFLPTLLAIREQMPEELYARCSVVCLTSDPLVRAEEYYECATTVLGILSSNVHILHRHCSTNDEEKAKLELVQSRLGSSLHLVTNEDDEVATIRDGFQYRYSEEAVAQALERILHKDFDWQQYNIITFDGYGVSGHPNHIDVSNGVRYACKEHSATVFTLDSVHLLVKYIPALFLLRYTMTSTGGNSVVRTCSKNASSTLFNALTKVYRSQLTWYRCCFAFISMYAYCNTLHYD